MGNRKRADKINILVFGVVFLFYLLVTLFLFHRQTVAYGGRYPSDMGAYIVEIQGIDSGFSFPYPVMFWVAGILARFTTPEHAMAVTVTFFNGLTLLSLKWFADSALKVRGGQDWKRGAAATAIAVTLLLVSMLYPLTYLGNYQEMGEGYLYRYKGVFSPNPYHNATYLAARPFAVAAFFLCCFCLREYEGKNRWVNRDYGLFSVFLFLATLTKPSFTLILVASAGSVMLVRLAAGRFRGVKAFFQLGIYFLPTLGVLLYQYSDVFTGTVLEEKGIGVGFFTAWSQACSNIPLAVASNLLFPVLVSWFHRRRLAQEKNLLFAWLLYGMGFLTLAFLYEKGYRMAHLNFAWGYMYGLFFLFVTSGLLLMKSTLARNLKPWKLWVQWGAYGLHLICGIDYFRVLLQGGLYL